MLKVYFSSCLQLWYYRPTKRLLFRINTSTDKISMAINPLCINDPTIYFRLDPGEPGVRTSARASESTLLVTAQELRNINRLKAEAIEEGREVVYANITYRPDSVGPYHTVTSGHTVVVSAERKDTTEDFPPGIEDNTKNSNDNQISDRSDSILDNTKTHVTSGPEDQEDIQDKIKELRVEITGLEQELKMKDNDIALQSIGKVSLLISQIEQKKEKLASLMNKEMLLKMKSSQHKLLNGIKITNKTAFGLASLKGKAKGKSINLLI